MTVVGVEIDRERPLASRGVVSRGVSATGKSGTESVMESGQSCGSVMLGVDCDRRGVASFYTGEYWYVYERH